MEKSESQAFIIEFRQVGQVVKVSAVDPVTFQEAIIQGPASASKEELTKAAVQKLNYVLKRQSSCNTDDGSDGYA